MNAKRILLVVCLIVSVSGVFAQLRYPIVGTYKKASMQGMAIHDDHAYLINDKGGVRVYDLKKQRIVGEFMLGSAADNTHANCVCFGSEFSDSNSINPVIYVSQCKSPYYCFVENISKDTTQLVQTIRAEEDSKAMPTLNWVVDTVNKNLYTIVAGLHILKFRLPTLTEGKEIVFTDKDVLDRFTVDFTNGLQDAKIRGDSLYILTGLQQSQAHQGEHARRAIKVVDLKEKRIVKDIDLTYLTTNEPEGIDFYGGKILISCGQEGGIWEIDLE